MNAPPSPVKQLSNPVSIRQGNLPLRIWGATALALLVIGSSLVWTSYDEYRKTLEQEYRFLETHARFADVQMAGTLRSIDLLLQRVIDARLSAPELPTDIVLRQQRDHLKGFPEIHYLMTIDSKGQVVAAESLEDPAGVLDVLKFNASQRDYFTVHRDAKPEDYYRYQLSRPFKAITNRYAVVISRAIRGKTGQFQGVAVVSLSPTYFASMLQQVLANDVVDAAAVHNRFGDIIYREPDPDKYIGKNIAGGEAFKSYLSSDQHLTRYFGVTVTDNVKRILVFSKVGDTNLDIGVSAQFDAVMAKWRNNLLAKLLIFVIVAGLTLALAWESQRRLLERRRNEEALHESEQRFRTLLQSIPSVAVQGYAQDGTTSYWNRASEKLYGYSADEAIGRNLLDLIIPGEMRSGVQAAMKEMFATGQPIPAGELSLMRKDGSKVAVFSSHVVVKGQLPEMFCVDIDLTERKRMEDALRESEFRWKFAIEGSGDGLWDWNVPQSKVFFSTRWKEMLGFTEDEIGSGLEEWSKRVHPDDMARVMADVQAHLDGTTPIYVNEHRVRCKDGSLKWILDRGLVVSRDGAGKALRVIGTHTDITERKQAESEILRSNSELAQFSYAISHDMRQPLRMISSYMQLLETDLADHLDAEKREFFGFAIDGAKRLDAMMLGLLEYSRVGRKGEPPAWLESRALLDDVLLFMQQVIADAQAAVRVEGDWPKILVSPDETLRLLQNLIGNALKFRIAGRTPEIILTSETVDNEWRMCVSDNGVGILPDQIDRLFQVFQRLQGRASYEGNGIGLALCRKIVEHHHGRIWAESAGEGKGSRFCFALPQEGFEKPV